ncbi:carboxymuconolactone decarboxylase family protein [Flavobacterium sp. NKUCC04_CG]|uniref:carboxymuconolactone decarboxylase family protein n=1 Tax=Flavobacterium sp. NKUCC04_CG TaxID=2842121 RepID=UPI00210211BD|nr:carboxymuconolactone decarboxylase family protein [Flavobacterium sp. NKUCC04_CG]
MRNFTIIILALLPILNMYSQMEKSARYPIGWNKLQQIDGEAGEKVINGLQDFSPELANLIIEYAFGSVYSLDKLPNKSKELVALSSLITQRAIPEMKVHFNGALNTGNTINEVKEVILQMSAYVGFPKSICAMNTFREVLEERKKQGIDDIEGKMFQTDDLTNLLEKGSKELALLDSMQEHKLRENFESFSPELVQFILETGYGEIYSRKNLDKKSRQTVTIAALATLGTAAAQLKFHIKAGLNIGLTVEEIKEIMLLISVYSGFPSAINGMAILKEVVNDANTL